MYVCMYLFLRWSFALVAQAGEQWSNLSSVQPSSHCNLCLLGSSKSHALASREAVITGARHYTRLVFLNFLVKIRVHCLGQVGLELLTSGDLPALASQRAGIIGMSHRSWPYLYFYF